MAVGIKYSFSLAFLLLSLLYIHHPEKAFAKKIIKIFTNQVEFSTAKEKICIAKSQLKCISETKECSYKYLNLTRTIWADYAQ